MERIKELQGRNDFDIINPYLEANYQQDYENAIKASKNQDSQIPVVLAPNRKPSYFRSHNDSQVSPSQIILKDDLSKIGLFKADINFHSEVKATISIKIDKIQSK